MYVSYSSYQIKLSSFNIYIFKGEETQIKKLFSVKLNYCHERSKELTGVMADTAK